MLIIINIQDERQHTTKRGNSSLSDGKLFWSHSQATRDWFYSRFIFITFSWYVSLKNILEASSASVIRRNHTSWSAQSEISFIQMELTDLIVWFHLLMEADPAFEKLYVFKVIGEGKCPRICISLMTHLHQNPQTNNGYFYSILQH
jgi:hypothetical protein